MEKELSGRAGRVDILLKATETDLSPVQFVDRVDQMHKRAPEPQSRRQQLFCHGERQAEQYHGVFLNDAGQ